MVYNMCVFSNDSSNCYVLKRPLDIDCKKIVSYLIVISNHFLSFHLVRKQLGIGSKDSLSHISVVSKDFTNHYFVRKSALIEKIEILPCRATPKDFGLFLSRKSNLNFQFLFSKSNGVFTS